MTATTSPKERWIDLLNEIWPDDVTNDEAAAMASILQQAWDRKHAGVVDLDLVRTRSRRRR